MSAMAGFSKNNAGDFCIQLGQIERDLFINLSEQVIEILGERKEVKDSDPLAALVGITGYDSLPEDEVLQRFLPDAYLDSGEAADFRRYTEFGLREKKSEHALAIRSHLLENKNDEILLSLNQAQAWLGAMNDMRLALGVRLNITENTHEGLEALAEDDPMHGVYSVYAWLGWLQESLLLALMQDMGGRQS